MVGNRRIAGQPLEERVEPSDTCSGQARPRTVEAFTPSATPGSSRAVPTSSRDSLGPLKQQRFESWFP